MIENGLTTINQLRIQVVAAGDRLAVQQRAAALLHAAGLQPRSLPPAAILYVRSLRDPLPGGLDLAGRDPRPSPRWERAVVAALDAAARNAARPALGMVPADTNAVLFWDRAEWLAGLAGDWLRGLLPLHWWWRSFLAGRDGGRAVLAAWLDAPEDAPAALAHLARREQARAFVQALPPGGARDLLARIVYCHGLPALQRALAADPPPAHSEAASESADSGGDPAARQAADAPGPPPATGAPWGAWTTGLRLDDLPLDAQCLLGIGLAVHRAQSAVRSSAFAEQVAAWLQTWAGQTPAAEMHPPQAAGSRPDSDPSDPAAAAQAGVAAPPPALPPAETQPPPLRPFAPPAAVPDAGPPAAEAAAAAPPLPAPAAPTAAADLLAASAAPSPAESTPYNAARSWYGDWDLPLPQEIETAFGGVFYLVNLGIYLGYYADFTLPLTPGIELSIYDFVALVAEALLGKQADELHADPVWALLGQLAGRSAAQRPGHGFTPPRGKPLRGWLAVQMAQIRPRLAAALDLPDPSGLPGLPDLLLRHAARVVVSATRLDVYLALAALPIRIRLSGLDRDPGWTPAAGRTITFFFE